MSNQIEFDIVQNPYRNLNAAGLNGITTSVYTGGTDLSGYTAVLNTPNASHIPTGGYPLPAPANAATQNGAQLPGTAAGTLGDHLATGTNGMSENKLDAFQFDLERRVEGNPFLSSVQVGLGTSGSTTFRRDRAILRWAPTPAPSRRRCRSNCHMPTTFSAGTHPGIAPIGARSTSTRCWRRLPR